jgi:hypothetical protein
MMQYSLLVAGLIMLPSAVSAQVSTATSGGSGVSTPPAFQKTTIAALPTCTTENAGTLYMVMDGSQKDQWGKEFSRKTDTPTPLIAVCDGQKWAVH